MFTTLFPLILQAVLPAILTPNHPHAPEAHSILAAASTGAVAEHSTASTGPSTVSEALVDVLSRALNLQLQAQAVSGAAPTPATLAIQQAIALITQPK